MTDEKNHFWGEGKSFVAGFLRGFRMWRMGDAELNSTAYPNFTWKVGPNVAICQNKLTIDSDAAWSVLPCECIACIGGASPANVHQRREETRAAFKNHKAPSRDQVCNSCGFYAYHMPERLLTERAYTPLRVSDLHIFGSIKATGSIVMGTLGFRAERVEVEALYGGGILSGPKIAERYGVPWFESPQELVEKFPFTRMQDFEYEEYPQPAVPPKPPATLTLAGIWAARRAPVINVAPLAAKYYSPKQNPTPFEWEANPVVQPFTEVEAEEEE